MRQVRHREPRSRKPEKREEKSKESPQYIVSKEMCSAIIDRMVNTRWASLNQHQAMKLIRPML